MVKPQCDICHTAIEGKVKRFGTIKRHPECDKKPMPCDICNEPVDEIKPRRTDAGKRHKECDKKPQPCIYCKEMVTTDRIKNSASGTQCHGQCYKEHFAKPFVQWLQNEIKNQSRSGNLPMSE